MNAAMYQSSWEPEDGLALDNPAPTCDVSRDDEGDVFLRFEEGDGSSVLVTQSPAQFRAFAAQVAAMVVEMDAPVADSVEVVK